MSPDHHTTMIYTDGATMAVLLTRRGKRMSERPMPIASAEAALAWCRLHAACLCVMPATPSVDPARN